MFNSSHSTTVSRELAFDVCQTIRSDAVNEPVAGSRVLGTHRCARLVLLALRLNLPQALPATMAGVSRPPASRVVSARTPVIAQALQANVPVVEDLDPTARLVVDGMLLPCWSWKDRSDLYPGRHKATGLDIQVACTLTGRLTRVSDPLPGRVYDTAAIRASGLLDVPDYDLPPGARAPRHIADRGGLPGVSRTALKDRLQGCPRHARQPSHQLPAAVGDFRPRIIYGQGQDIMPTAVAQPPAPTTGNH